MLFRSQQGRCVAANVVRAVAGEPYRQFKYVDKGALATVGRAFAILQLGKFKLSGLLAWIIWSLVHVAYLIGFRNRAIVMFEWAWAYITYQRGARLITGDAEEHVSAAGSTDAKPRSQIQAGRS